MNGQRSIVIAILTILGSTAGLLLVRSLLFGLMQRIARRTETRLDDLLVAGLRFPSLFLVGVIATYIGIRLTDLPASRFDYARSGMHLSIILTITVGLANVSDRMLDYFLKSAKLPISGTSLLLGVANASANAASRALMRPSPSSRKTARRRRT